MAKKKSVGKEVRKKDDRILYAFLATFLSIIGFVIALVVKREDKYVMYYAKQSLVIFVIGAVLGIIGKLFNILPIIGTLINFAIGILIVVMWFVSWMYALSGKEKTIPIVSDWTKKINL